MRNPENPSAIVETMAAELLEAVSTGENVDSELIEYAENVIRAHQVYVQLLYVGMVVEQITQLVLYFKTQDELVEDLDTKVLAQANNAEKIRAVTALNSAIKTKVEIINSMMASKDAIGMLTSSLRDTFAGGDSLLIEGGADENILNMLKELPSDQRQRIVGYAVNALRKGMGAQSEQPE